MGPVTPPRGPGASGRAFYLDAETGPSRRAPRWCKPTAGD